MECFKCFKVDVFFTILENVPTFLIPFLVFHKKLLVKSVRKNLGYSRPGE